MDRVDLAGNPDLLEPLARHGLPKEAGKPRQIEFSRLNFNYLVMSKRKLLAMVVDGLVDGWDDPRMPTLQGIRRRGYTPSALRLMVDRVGISKQNSLLDISIPVSYTHLDVYKRQRLLRPTNSTSENSTSATW